MLDRQEFLDTIFGQREAGERICVSRATERTDGGIYFTNRLDTDSIFARWNHADTPSAWYFCVSAVTGSRKPLDGGGLGGVQRGRDHLTRAFVLVLDDIGTKATAPDLEPSYVIETSQGNYQYGYLLHPTDNFTQYEALAKHCAAMGWSDSGAGGSYRVMRLPGSANLKPTAFGWRSIVTQWSPERVWGLENLCELLECKRVDKTYQVARKPLPSKEGVDELYNYLAKNSLILSDIGSEWIKVQCPWHLDHSNDDTSAGYSPLGRGGSWAANRSFRCQHGHCSQKTFKDFMMFHKSNGGPRVQGFDHSPWTQDEDFQQKLREDLDLILSILNKGKNQ